MALVIPPRKAESMHGIWHAAAWQHRSSELSYEKMESGKQDVAHDVEAQGEVRAATGAAAAGSIVTITLYYLEP